MELSNYYGKTVKIVDIDDKIFIGFVDEYFYPDDNENGKESITIETTQGPIEFYEKDIKRIEVLDKHLRV